MATYETIFYGILFAFALVVGFLSTGVPFYLACICVVSFAIVIVAHVADKSLRGDASDRAEKIGRIAMWVFAAASFLLFVAVMFVLGSGGGQGNLSPSGPTLPPRVPSLP